MALIDDATWDAARWPNFSPDELRCSHTGKLFVCPDALDKLQLLRTHLGRPIFITSACRDATHPVEARKPQPGTHTRGCAFDFRADGRMQYEVLAVAQALGFTGIGLAKTWMHLDTWDGGPRPNVWTYA